MTTKLEQFLMSQGLRSMGTSLAHVGVKGMKWGVRNDKVGIGSLSSKSGYAAVPHGSAKPSSKELKTASKVAAHAAGSIKKNMPALLKEATAKTGIDPSSPTVSKTQASANKYNFAVADAFRNHALSVIPKGLDASVHLTKSDALVYVGTPKAVSEFRKSIKHSDIGQVLLKLIYDDAGFIIDVDDPAMSHSETLDFLAHYGIKGMKWGFRRTDAQLAKAKESADAIRARTTLETIKKTKSVASVSDADLNHLVSRINLEKRYAEAVDTKSSSKPLATTHKGIKSLLGVGKTMNTAIEFARSPAGRLLASKLKLSKAVKYADQAQRLKDLAELDRPKKD